jgi:hypothetical protein
MGQRVGALLLNNFVMYLDRVYRLQLEFCEVSQMLAGAQKLEEHDQLVQRRMEIVAEASELVHELDPGIPIYRVPAGASFSKQVFATASK